MSKHTKGTWKAQPINSIGTIEIHADDVKIGVCFHRGIGREQQEANARLWEAAPELLDELKKLIAISDIGNKEDHKILSLYDRAAERALALVAKVEGKEVPA